MSGAEHRGPTREALDEMILMKLYPLLVALFLCLSVTKGFVPEEPKYVNATLGESVVLFCGFEYPENYPVPHMIVWYKQDINDHIFSQVAPPDGPPSFGVGYEGRLSLVHQASLNLTNVQETDQGWYECIVYFHVHHLFIPNFTIVHLDVYGKVPEEPKHVTAALGEDVILFCGFEFPENKSEPYVIEWQKQDIKQPIYIWHDRHPSYSGKGYKDRVSLAHQASLNLTKVRLTDKGWYECKVFFLHRPPDSRENGTWVHLDVRGPDSPHFKTKPPDVVHVKVGESVTLPCEAEGIPPFNLTWYKNNSPLEESRTVQISPTELRINNLLQADTGDYTCKARYKDENATATSKVIVTEESNYFSAILGEDGILFCDFEFPENKPVPYEVQWYKQGIEKPIYIWHQSLPPYFRYGRFSLAHRASLNITKVRKTDKGWYECKVLNRHTKSKLNSTWVHLDVFGPVSIQIPPQNSTQLEGDRALFFCKANVPDLSNVTHRWFHNGVEINKLPWLENRTYIVMGTLVIESISAEDSGEFTCEVSNGIGTPETASAFLSVGYPARVTFSPAIQYLHVGESGIINCYFEANPPFIFVKWTKDGRQFNPYSIPGVVTLNNGSLLFERVTPSVQGMYSCAPYNAYGSERSSYFMNVLVRELPKFIIKPEEIYQISVDNEITLPCDGIADPQPIVTWRRADGSDLPWERVFNHGGNLTIRGLKKEDYGRYECVLENGIAKIVTSTLLLVESTAHGPTNVTVNTSSVAATLNWLPAYERGRIPFEYDVRYRVADQDDSDWRTVNSYWTITFTVYNLQADTEYDFQVLSRNKLGNEMFSPIVRAKTKTADYVGGSGGTVSSTPLRSSTHSAWYWENLLESVILANSPLYRWRIIKIKCNENN